MGRSLQRGLVMSISPTQRMPYLSSQARMASRASRPPASLGSSSRKPSSSTCSQERHHLRMRADHVGDVQERQPHLRRDVVGDGLRERVGRVLLAEPRLQLVVEPPGGLHRRHEHLMALRIEQDPPQLLDVGQDEVEQRRSGPRPDVALQGGDGGLAARDQVGDDRRIGLDRGGRRGGPPAGGPPGLSSGSDGMKSPRSRTVSQRVPDQRIAPPHDLEEARRGSPATKGPGSRRRTDARRLRPWAVGSSSATRIAPGASWRRSSSARDRRRRRRGSRGRRRPGWGIGVVVGSRPVDLLETRHVSAHPRPPDLAGQRVWPKPADSRA